MELRRVIDSRGNQEARQVGQQLGLVIGYALAEATKFVTPSAFALGAREGGPSRPE